MTFKHKLWKILAMDIEKYLNKASVLLSHLPENQRLEIIQLLRKRIEGELESNPSGSARSIIKNLGPMPNLLNEYLISKGHYPIRPQSNFWKYFFITVVVLVIIFIVLGYFLVSKFTPIIKVDEKKGRVTILGGLIDVNSDLGTVKIDSHFDMNMKNTHSFKGEQVIDKVKSIDFHFDNGKFTVLTSQTNEMKWDCNLSQQVTSNPIIIDKKQNMFLKFSAYKGVQCDLFIPKGKSFTLHGMNGHITYERPEFKSYTSIVNGNVILNSDKSLKYKLQTKVINGVVDTQKDIQATNGIETRITVTNGRIIIK